MLQEQIMILQLTLECMITFSPLQKIAVSKATCKPTL